MLPAKEPQTRHVHLLDDVVIDQIAAGEVVERPSSVVKELVENAIDAGATAISVAIDNGGKSRLEVGDDGCGMSEADAQLALKRHATSKISSAEDLTKVSTFGFRGEALASIASVSSLRLRTRTSTAARGMQFNVRGGEVVSTAEADCVVGTSVSVEQLFFNVPARRKFLKSDRAEARRIKELLIDVVLGHPEIALTFVSDGKLIFRLKPQAGLLERAKELSLAGKKPLQLEATKRTPKGEIRVEGVLAPPVESAGTSGLLSVLVNRRPVKDRALAAAVRQGFGPYLKSNQYPKGVVALSLPPSEVDVNVHPQKTEVRFREPGELFRAVFGAVRECLSSHQFSIPNLNYQGPRVESKRGGPADTQRPVQFGARPNREAVHIRAIEPEREMSHAEVRSNDRLRYLGQILHCYLLFEGEESLQLLDMHAAHERVMFFRIKTEVLSGKPKSQQLLVPERIQLEFASQQELERTAAALNTVGYDAQLFGEDELVIRAVPALLAHVAPLQIVRDLLEAPEWSEWSAKFDKAIDEVVARIACHKSIRSGRELKREEVYQLLEDLERAESSAYCPHGRPVLVTLDRAQLEELFGRIQK